VQIFPCPFCGERPDAEFRYGGDARKSRPGRDCSDAEWAHYMHQRANRRGEALELWQHAAGCGRWIEIRRDTASHAVIATEPMTR
jgi:sarcosine oxidase subunit delta